MRLSTLDLAHVLLGLQLVQSLEDEPQDGQRLASIADDGKPLLPDGQNPMSASEIDALCERLRAGATENQHYTIFYTDVEGEVHCYTTDADSYSQAVDIFERDPGAPEYRDLLHVVEHIQSAVPVQEGGCPDGYTTTHDQRRGVYRLWRVFDTDDGTPDEIEDGFATREETIKVAIACAKGDREGSTAPAGASGKVEQALAHVATIHPTVAQVSYDSDLRWRYADNEGSPLSFDGSEDMALLEEAADEAYDRGLVNTPVRL